MGDNAGCALATAYNDGMESRPERHIADILKERNIEIVGADPVTRHGFTQVPNFILTKKELSVGANPTFPTGALILEFCRQKLNLFKGR
jgi:hypothetical protein